MRNITSSLFIGIPHKLCLAFRLRPSENKEHENPDNSAVRFYFGSAGRS